MTASDHAPRQAVRFPLPRGGRPQMETGDRGADARCSVGGNRGLARPQIYPGDQPDACYPTPGAIGSGSQVVIGPPPQVAGSGTSDGDDLAKNAVSLPAFSRSWRGVPALASRRCSAAHAAL